MISTYPPAVITLWDRSDGPDAVREAKALLSKTRREQARFHNEVQKDDDRWAEGSRLPICVTPAAESVDVLDPPKHY